MRLGVRARPVLDAARHDQEFTFGEIEAGLDALGVAVVHVKRAADDEEHFILMVVMMPEELASDFDELHVLAVEFAHYLGGPRFGELREFR